MVDLLAIDPGPEQSAYVLLRDGTPIMNGILDNPTMLGLVRGSDMDHIAIEGIQSFGMPVGAETFNTCIWIGRFIEAAEKPHTLVYRSEVKSHLCKNARAKDPNIRQALIDRFGGDRAIGKKKTPGPLYSIKSHCWSALAVAITYWDGARNAA